MATYNYSVKTDDSCAKAVGRALPISTKTSKEICAYVRGKPVQKALSILKEVGAGTHAVPYHYAINIGHRAGRMRSGRFPQKAATHIAQIISSAAANGEHKGFNTNDLVLVHISAQIGNRTLRPGRFRHSSKSTHIEVVVKEQPPQKEEQKKSVSTKKQHANKRATTSKTKNTDKQNEMHNDTKPAAHTHTSHTASGTQERTSTT